jgi:hypothetical protein
MKNRPARLGLALLLLAVAWHPVAHLVAVVLAGVLGLAAAHPAVALTVVAAVLLLGSVPGRPVERALSRLAGARTFAGGGER